MVLKVDGHSVPSKLSECSTDTFQKIADWDADKPLSERDRVKLYAILCDKPYEVILNNDDETLSGALWECSRFVYEDPIDETLPKFIQFRKRDLAINKNYKMTIGQGIHLRQAINSGVNPNTLISLAVAIYLQPLVDGVFDYDKAKEYEKEVRAMPITVTYPIGFFFLSKLRPSGIGYFWNWLLTIRMKMLGVRLSPSSPRVISWLGISRLHY